MNKYSNFCFFLMATYGLLYTPIIVPSLNVQQYNVVKNLFNRYKRPVTVLEIGSKNHELLFSITQRHNACGIIADPAMPTQSLTHCNTHNQDNIILLNKQLHLEDLKQLGECEHFDIVLIADITRYCTKKQWKQTLDALFNLGDYIVVSIPQNLHQEKLVTYFTQHERTHVHQQSKNIFIYAKKKTYLLRKYWDNPTLNKERYKIHSTFKKKTFTKKRHGITTTTPWTPGINLLTFKKLDGAYPSRTTMRELLEPLKYIDHNDLYIYNIIIQGKKLLPIDFNDLCKPVNPQQTVQSMLNNHFPEK